LFANSDALQAPPPLKIPSNWSAEKFQYRAYQSKDSFRRNEMCYTITWQEARRAIIYDLERSSAEEGLIKVGFQCADIPAKDKTQWEVIHSEDIWVDLLAELKINKINLDSGVPGTKSKLPIRFADSAVSFSSLISTLLIYLF
jgi:hypothetical protein